MSLIEDPKQYRYDLNNGDGEMPALGFGTLVSDSRQTRNATIAAVEVGFRHLDCAERYRNEDEVGLALKELFAAGTVRREDLFVTTKLGTSIVPLRLGVPPEIAILTLRRE